MKTQLLYHRLRSTAQLVLLSETARACGLALALLLAALLVALAADAVLALDPWALVAVDGLAVALVVAAFVSVAWAMYRNSFSAPRTARLIERRLDVDDNRLINAVHLAELSQNVESGELRELAVSEGNALALEVSPARVVGLGRLKKPAALFVLAVGAMVAALLLVPRVFEAVIPRYLNPTADLPPFTLLEFDVTCTPEAIYQGRPAAIWARITGPGLPDQATVVFVDDTERQRLPMLRSDTVRARPESLEADPDHRFALNIERAERSREFYIDTPSGRSRRFSLDVLPVPIFERTTVRYEFPEYTGWPQSNQPLEATGLRAIENTEITLTVESNLPLRQAEVTLRPTKKTWRTVTVMLKPTAANPKLVSGSFPLRFNGTYTIALTASDGTPGNDTMEGPLACTADELPTVQIIEPNVEVIAPETWKVPVVISASDDVGLDRIVLHRSINGWGPFDREVPITRSGPTYATARYEFDLPALGARGGDIITYFATAFDNHPGGTHFRDTTTYVIRVITEEDYLAYARTKYRMEQLEEELDYYLRKLQDLAERREKLVEELEKLSRKIDDNDDKLTAEDRERLEELEAQYSQYSLMADLLAAEMQERAELPQLYEFEKAYTNQLRNMAETLRGQSAAGQKVLEEGRQMRARGPQPLEEARHVEKMLDQLRRDQDDSRESGRQTQLTKEEMARIRKADEMAALVEQIQSIAKQQRDLATRLGQFRNKERLSPTEQIRAQRIAEDQDNLRRELQEALKELEAKADQAREDLPRMSASARKIVEAVRGLKVTRDQDDANRLAKMGQGRYAHRAADSAARKLESLMSECKGTKGQGSKDLDGCLKLTKQSMLKSLKQLAQGRGVPSLGGQGGQGGGYYGSRARMTLAGPHSPGGGGESESGRGRRGRGRGWPMPGTKVDRPDAEALNPGATTARGTEGGGGMPGVPARWRPLAEAYFRRLADESK